MAGPLSRGASPLAVVLLVFAILSSGCNGGGTAEVGEIPGRAGVAAVQDNSRIVVNSLDDSEAPPAGFETLRSALARLDRGGTIEFDPSLDNGTIELSIVGEAHSALKGEVFTMVAGRWEFQGFLERDYGASALYADKSVVIDASSLPSGITLRWTGGESNRARVLAVLGDLTLRNVTILDGFSSFAPIDNNAAQPFTLARGGAVACWGTSTFENCTFGGNRVLGDNTASRDRGAFGGAVYGDAIVMDNCIVAGNRAEGYGAAGGGVYSVSGRENNPYETSLAGCSITGNRVTGQHAYGGGVYTDGGSVGYMTPLKLANCTIARNRVEDNPSIAESSRTQYYYRGGGIYMSNGWIEMASCTVAENEVDGVPFRFGGKPNMGGGGMCATIGNAHDVEDMQIRHSVLAGNRVYGEAEDLFTGSLVHFFSHGYNRIGRIDFSQMLVPIPPWDCLSRKHWPKEGDGHGASLSELLLVSEAKRHPSILSAGTDAGQPALLWYPPADSLVDRVPPYGYNVSNVMASYAAWPEDDFAPLLNMVMGKLRGMYGAGFGSALDGYSTLTFNAIPYEWPSDNTNLPWIGFWRALDNEIGDRMEVEKLGDEFWGSMPSGPPGSGYSWYTWEVTPVLLSAADQRGLPRPIGVRGDIGAVERSLSEVPTPAVAPAGSSGGGCSSAPGADGTGGGAGTALALLLPAALIRGFLRRGIFRLPPDSRLL